MYYKLHSRLHEGSFISSIISSIYLIYYILTTNGQTSCIFHTLGSMPLPRLQPGLELVPIRPVAMLAGSLECKAGELYQLFWFLKPSKSYSRWNEWNSQFKKTQNNVVICCLQMSTTHRSFNEDKLANGHNLSRLALPAVPWVRVESCSVGDNT